MRDYNRACVLAIKGDHLVLDAAGGQLSLSQETDRANRCNVLHKRVPVVHNHLGGRSIADPNDSLRRGRIYEGHDSPSGLLVGCVSRQHVAARGDRH